MDFFSPDFLTAVREFCRHGAWAYVLVHASLGVAGIPCSPLTLIAGSLWGPVWGVVYSVIALILSCVVTFSLSRAFGKRVLAYLPTRLRTRIEGLCGHVFFNKWQSVAMFSANPLVPASSAGYLFGLTRLPLPTYLAATILGTLPANVIFAAFGDSMYQSAENGSLLKFLINFLLFIVVVLVYRLVSKKMSGSGKDKPS